MSREAKFIEKQFRKTLEMIYNSDSSSFLNYINSCKLESLNNTNKDGNTLLMVAASFNRGDLVEALLNEDVKVSLQNGKGQTAAMIARLNGHEEMAVALSRLEALECLEMTESSRRLWIEAKEAIERSEVTESSKRLETERGENRERLKIAVALSGLEAGEDLVKLDEQLSGIEGRKGKSWVEKARDESNFRSGLSVA